MARGTIPSLTEALNYSVNRKNDVEGVRQSLYDFLLYPTAGQTQLTFFANPIGQPGSSSPGLTTASAKTLADTNMEAAGQLPAPKMFLLESIEIVFQPGSVSTAATFTPQVAHYAAAAPAATDSATKTGGAINDISAVYGAGYGNLFIGSKTYLTEAPIGRFPPKTRLEMDAAIASNNATTQTIEMATIKAGGRPYYVEPAILLPSTQNFNFTLNWPVAVATPSGFNGRIGAIFDGYLYRNSQ